VPTPADGPGEDQYLVFDVAGEAYAVGILRAREIVAHDTLTELPASPPWVRGVMSLRGSPVPVIDLAAKLGRGPSSLARRSCIVLLEVETGGQRSLMGVIADGVDRVMQLPRRQIVPPPALAGNIPTDLVVGIAELGRKFVLILDIDKVLSPGASAPVDAAHG
jgi:purine-binding chemotaxis protein CheW